MNPNRTEIEPLGEDRPRPHILLCVLGMSPQVLTELLWFYWCHRKPTVPISEVHVVSTQAGLTILRERVGLPNQLDSPMADLLAFSGQKPEDVAFDETTLHLLKGPDGMPLDDVRTADEVAACINQMTRLIGVLKAREDRPVLHASIAGGRKTLGTSLALALQLYAEASDELVHVLVEPSGFEYCREFFFPDQSQQDLIIEKQPRKASAASVDVASIPLLHLGETLQQQFQAPEVSYAQMVGALQGDLQALLLDTLVIDLAAGEVRAGSRVAKFTRQEMAIYGFYVSRCPQKGAGGAGPGDWFIADHDGEQAPWPEEALEQMRQCSEAAGYKVQDAMRKDRAKLTGYGRHPGWFGPRLERYELGPQRSHIAKKLKKAFGERVGKLLQVDVWVVPEPDKGKGEGRSERRHGVDLREVRFQLLMSSNS